MPRPEQCFKAAESRNTSPQRNVASVNNGLENLLSPSNELQSEATFRVQEQSCMACGGLGCGKCREKEACMACGGLGCGSCRKKDQAGQSGAATTKTSCGAADYDYNTPLPGLPLPEGLEETLRALRAQEAFFRALCNHHLLWEARVEILFQRQEQNIAQSVSNAVLKELAKGSGGPMCPSPTSPVTLSVTDGVTASQDNGDSMKSDREKAMTDFREKFNMGHAPGHGQAHKPHKAPNADGAEQLGDEVSIHSDELPPDPPVIAFFRRIITSRPWDFTVAALIFLNAVSVGFQADWAIRNIGQDAPVSFTVIDWIFTTLFFAELVLRMTVERSEFFKSWNPNVKWNVFDTCIVASSGPEIFVLIGDAKVGSLPLLRVVRMARLMRLLRVVKVMSFFRDLRMMIMGITSSAKPLLWAMVILILLQFIFASCFLQIITDEFALMDDKGASQTETIENFASLVRAMYTLWLSVSGGVDWGDVAEPLVDMGFILGIFFSVYMAISVLCVLNIITGVFVESATKNAMQDKEHHFLEELAFQQEWQQDCLKLFETVDKNKSGSISLAEFQKALDDDRLRSAFRKIGLDVTPNTAESLFRLIDIDGSGEVGTDEFFCALQEVQGDPQRIDIVKMRHDMMSINHNLNRLTKGLAGIN